MMVLTIAVYWPSLSGGFLFDDSIYVQNPAVFVQSMRLGDWAHAALSQVGTNQFRGLSMLSFAANHFITGANPWWFKLTNLCIHLCNGWLVYFLLANLVRLRNEVAQVNGKGEFAVSGNLFSALVAGLWMLAPINLTNVAYISQRIESLANVFVLLGLVAYVRWRRRHFSGSGFAYGGGIIVVVAAIAGLTAKESAALLPLFTVCIEVALTGFRNKDGRLSRPVVATHVLLLMLPMLVGLWWLSRWILISYAEVRTFTLSDRLWTETRVLVDYLDWTLLPNLGSLTFYHDDLTLSHGLLSPPTTLGAMVLLALLLALAAWQRSRRPLFCLGVLWFFAGHAMTATVIPLELVFEHRNYFPSIGALLAVSSGVCSLPGRLTGTFRTTLAISAIALFSTTTFLRAQEWSDPIRLAHAEATKRPDSMRAQYGWALTLMMAAGTDRDSPLLTEARSILHRIVDRDDSGVAPAQALIFLAGRDGQPIDPHWWQEILRKSRMGPPSKTDIQAIAFLSRCMSRSICPNQPQQMQTVFLAAMDASSNNPELLSAYADYAYRKLNDGQLADRLGTEAVTRSPAVPTYRYNLVRLLLATGHVDEARQQMAILRTMNRWGSLDREIGELNVLLHKADVARTDGLLPAPAGDPALRTQAP